MKKAVSDFFRYQAQTSPHPLAMEISHAKGSYIFDINQKAYLDFVAGVSACTLGHSHPKIISAVKKQLESYMHVMVYGEYIQEPAVALTRELAQHLPEPLETTYLVNSGTEAIEGALKLAKKATGRTEIIAASHAYHGNTMGALSIMGYETRKKAFRPLIPGGKFIRFNKEEDIALITSKTAAVVLETIQGGAGFILPENGYLQKVRKRCKETGTLLILDEIQPGFGRTGAMFGFQHYGVIPDILVMGKGMGGGMPVGAFMASRELMSELSASPKLGHITTFGGHPVIASACLATLRELSQTDLIPDALKKEARFRSLLKHSLIKEIRGKGLMLALILENEHYVNEVIFECQNNGLILFWLLFEPKAIRITPPLTISDSEIEQGCNILLKALDKVKKMHVN